MFIPMLCLFYALGKILKRINNLIEESQQRTQESKKKFLEAVEKLNKGSSPNKGK